MPRTLVACSGGADSTALALTLAALVRHDAPSRLALAYIRHDMQPAQDVEADANAVRALASSLGVSFLTGDALAAPGPRTESVYRALRYAALAKIARTHGFAFVATAHHADDQLESLILALARGCGPAGLRGIAPRRAIDAGPPPIILIRPMLRVAHQEALHLCRECGVAWREDASNLDCSRRRAALRHGPVAELMRLMPAAGARAAHTASLMRDLTRLLHDQADAAFVPRSGPWPRERLRTMPGVVLAHGLRRALTALHPEAADAFSSRAMAPIVRAIRAKIGETRRFSLAQGTTVVVSADQVTLSMDGSVQKRSGET